MTRTLVEGSEAVALAMIDAGCRFFTGYPMTPFTEVLEHMARLLPSVGGVCVNAESELEAVGMTWGATAGGTRSATGSTGQGLSLMQESIAEAPLAGLGFVVINMARGQGDYFQLTRGGGHGDYRTPVIAPAGPHELPELVSLAFEWADTWRNPVVVVGDYELAHTWVDQETGSPLAPPRPAPAWALDGSSGGTGRAKLLSPLGAAKQREGVGYDLAAHYETCDQRRRAMESGIEPMAAVLGVEDAELVVVAYGTMARYAEAAARDLTTVGLPVRVVRPVTLWPFPESQVRDASADAAAVVVYENNGGQMIDDVRLALLGRVPVIGLNGFRTDPSGFGISPEVSVRDLVASLQTIASETRARI